MILGRGGHKYEIEHWDLPLLERVRSQLSGNADELPWARYDSPFERKWALTEKFQLPSDLQVLISLLEGQKANLEKVFGVRLFADDERFYTGVFRYGHNDHLGVHVDAGISPTGLRKAVTSLLYLNGGEPLEFWQGTTCCTPDPKLDSLTDEISTSPGTVVHLVNNDYAWHGVRSNYRHWRERLVVTVSFLTPELDRFHNRRQRAFFVPRPNENWSEETYRLRDIRADSERYAEAYRV